MTHCSGRTQDFGAQAHSKRLIYTTEAQQHREQGAHDANIRGRGNHHNKDLKHLRFHYLFTVKS